MSIECACRHCGKTFTRWAAQVRAGGGRYCSRSCRSKHCNDNRVYVSGPENPSWIDGRSFKRAEPRVEPTLYDLVCRRCQQPFQRTASYLRHKGAGQFCSRTCACKAIGYLPGSEHPMWSGGVTPEKRAEYIRQSRRRHPQHVFARNVIAHLIEDGKLIRPTTCSKCDSECRPHAHHDDYSKPREIRWLCPGCHYAFHRQVGRSVHVAEVIASE